MGCAAAKERKEKPQPEPGAVDLAPSGSSGAEASSSIRNTGAAPQADFNVLGERVVYEVELIRSGAAGATLPVKLEVGSDGIMLRQQDDAPIRSFGWSSLYGWAVKETAFRLQTDELGTALEMRAPDPAAVCTACSDSAKRKVSHLVFSEGGARMQPPPTT